MIEEGFGRGVAISVLAETVLMLRSRFDPKDPNHTDWARGWLAAADQIVEDTNMLLGQAIPPVSGGSVTFDGVRYVPVAADELARLRAFEAAIKALLEGSWTSAATSSSASTSPAEARAAYEADPTRRCPCGEAIPYEYRHNRIFCSPEHQKEYQAKRQTDPTKHVTFTCQNEACGKSVTRYKNYGNGHLKYCSNECARTHTKTRKFYAVEGFDIDFESSWEVLAWAKF